MKLLRATTSVLASLILIGVPGLTVWLASSLIAFHGGPREAALVGGLLLFPLLPALWEWRATAGWKRRLARRRQLVGQPKRTFRLFTRLALRTLLICLAFIGGMVAWFPKVTFAALATRGDWFLEPGDRGEPWRTAVFWTAQRLEGLHRLANPNPWVTHTDGEALAAITPTPVPPAPTGSGARWRKLTDEERERLEGVKNAKRPPPPPIDGTTVAKLPEDHEPAPEPPPTEAPVVLDTGGTHWPWANDVSPLLSAMTAQDEGSIASVAAFVRAHEPDPFKRVKALHDYVVTRLEYDVPALKAGAARPAQDAETVFATRKAVCEGYARLLVELGRLTGDRVVYLGGDVREENGAAAPIGHAWNAVELNGRWFLLDATWDDPVGPDGRSTSYRTDYLFIPPAIAVWSHFPDDERWQLLEKPLSRGDFLRQPFARPGIAREGLTLISPNRVAVDASETLPIKLENPQRRWLIVEYRANGARKQCGTTNAAHVELTCPVPESGEALLYSNDQEYGQFEKIAGFTVTRR